jgi:hypothetical protein
MPVQVTVAETSAVDAIAATTRRTGLDDARRLVE